MSSVKACIGGIGLALALACGAARAQSAADPGLTLVAPAFTAQPSIAQIDAALPPALRRLDLPSYAILTCTVGDEGVLDDCAATHEAPAGNGVGAAAVGLADLYKSDKPKGDKLIVPVMFDAARKPLDQTASGDAGLIQGLVDAANRPSRDAANLTVLICQAADDGTVEGCQIDYQLTLDPDLAAYQIGLAQREVLPPAGVPSPRGYQSFYLLFTDGADRPAPVLANAPTPDAFYPAAANGAGRVRLACTITAGGFAKDCSLASETPPGQGFAAAALEYAGRSTFLPKLIDGQALDAPLTFEVRLSPPDQAAEEAEPEPDPAPAPDAPPVAAPPDPASTGPAKPLPQAAKSPIAPSVSSGAAKP